MVSAHPQKYHFIEIYKIYHFNVNLIHKYRYVNISIHECLGPIQCNLIADYYMRQTLKIPIF